VDTGDELLALPFNLPGGAPPITYMVDNTQYVGFATGTQFLVLKVGGTKCRIPRQHPPVSGAEGAFRRVVHPVPPPADAGKELHGQDKQ
jgi:hypothetical protein